VKNSRNRITPTLFIAGTLPLIVSDSHSFLTHTAFADEAAPVQVQSQSSTQVVALPEAPALLRKLAGNATITPLDPATIQVKRFRYGGNRQPQVVTVVSDALWEFNNRIYIREKETGQWFLGARSEADPQIIETRSRFSNLEQMVRTLDYPPLPQPPKGYSIREVRRFDDFPVRLASDASGQTVYVLMTNGDIWQLDRSTDNFVRVLAAMLIWTWLRFIAWCRVCSSIRRVVSISSPISATKPWCRAATT
jgi:hypothetical protein